MVENMTYADSAWSDISISAWLNFRDVFAKVQPAKPSRGTNLHRPVLRNVPKQLYESFVQQLTTLDRSGARSLEWMFAVDDDEPLFLLLFDGKIPLRKAGSGGEFAFVSRCVRGFVH